MDIEMSGLRKIDSNHFIKVVFPVTSQSEVAPGVLWPPVKAEGIWCERVQDEVCRVDNVPFFTDTVSLGDVVRFCNISETAPIFSSVVSRAGNSTIRVIVDEDVKESVLEAALLLDMLRARGCDVEVGSSGLFSINVPRAMYADAWALIASAREEGLWWVDLGWHVEE